MVASEVALRLGAPADAAPLAALCLRSRTAALHDALGANGLDCQGYVAYRPGTFILGDALDGGRCNFGDDVWVLLIEKDAQAAKARAISAASAAQPVVFGDNWVVMVGKAKPEAGNLVVTAIGGQLLAGPG